MLDCAERVVESINNTVKKNRNGMLKSILGVG